MVLIEKPKGGYRGIGIFHSWYRLRTGIRREVAREWEKSHSRGYLAACAGASCFDAIWRHTIKAEATVVVHEKVIGFTWDLKEFYEHIARPLLASRGKDLGLAPALIQVACSMYAAGRFLTMDKASA